MWRLNNLFKVTKDDLLKTKNQLFPMCKAPFERSRASFINNRLNQIFTVTCFSLPENVCELEINVFKYSYSKFYVLRAKKLMPKSNVKMNSKIPAFSHARAPPLSPLQDPTALSKYPAHNEEKCNVLLYTCSALQTSCGKIFK